MSSIVGQNSARGAAKRRPLIEHLKGLSLHEQGRFADALIAYHLLGTAPRPGVPSTTCPCGAVFVPRAGRGRPRRWCEACKTPHRKAA